MFLATEGSEVVGCGVDELYDDSAVALLWSLILLVAIGILGGDSKSGCYSGTSSRGALLYELSLANLLVAEDMIVKSRGYLQAKGKEAER